MPSDWIKKNLSVNGLRIQKELKGEKCYDIQLVNKPKKNICTLDHLVVYWYAILLRETISDLQTLRRLTQKTKRLFVIKSQFLNTIDLKK